jgi:hypothetical protein
MPGGALAAEPQAREEQKVLEPREPEVEGALLRE